VRRRCSPVDLRWRGRVAHAPGRRQRGTEFREGSRCGHWLPTTVRGRRLGCVTPPVRREALVDWVEVRDLSPPSRRSGAVKLGAAGLGRRRDGWQAAPTKPRRVGTARRRGCGERGGKAYARNRRLRLSKTHRLEPGGSGPEVTRTCLPHYGGGELPEMSAGLRGGRGDVLRGRHP